MGGRSSPEEGLRPYACPDYCAASLRAHGHPRSRSRGAHRRPVPRPDARCRTAGRWDRGKDRRLGPTPARLRDRPQERGHLRRARRDRRPGRGHRARPAVAAQRSGAAYQSHPSGPEVGREAMAGETVITVVGNVTDDPELRFTPAGAAVANFTVASTPRSFDRQSNEWKDGDTLFLRCSVWRQAAENVAESLQRGSRVIVQGRLRQRSFETREGEKRTVVELEVDEVGPSLKYATAKVQKMNRSGGGGGGFGSSGGGGGARPQGGGGGNG